MVPTGEYFMISEYHYVKIDTNYEQIFDQICVIRNLTLSA